MNVKEAKKVVQEIMQDFSNATGEACSKIYLIENKDLKEGRDYLVEYVGAVREDYRKDTLGETISGPKGTVIALYVTEIRDAEELRHVALHECGHKFFKDKHPEIVRKQENKGYSERKRYGFTLFDEFIAEAMANMLGSGKVFEHSKKQFDLKLKLYEALPGLNPLFAPMQRDMLQLGVTVVPAQLGIYAAMMLTDPTIMDLMTQDPSFDRGLPIKKNPRLADTIQDILEWLSNYMQSHRFADYTITEDDLDILGKYLFRIENLRS